MLARFSITRTRSGSCRSGEPSPTESFRINQLTLQPGQRSAVVRAVVSPLYDATAAASPGSAPRGWTAWVEPLGRRDGRRGRWVVAFDRNPGGDVRVKAPFAGSGGNTADV